MLTYIIIFFVCLYIWGFFIEPNLITVKKYNVKFLDGRKIVFVSDFHIGKHDFKRLRKIVKKINELKPDLVLSGGDYVNGHSGKNSMPIDKIAGELSKINVPIISVLGNHDINYDKYTTKKALEDVGVIVLDNSSTKFGNISVSGVGGKNVLPEEIRASLENSDDIKILLSHTPDVYYDVNENVDLILAGHVHGGQVRLPFVGALICPSNYGTKFSCGDFSETQNRMIVTRGLGTSILNVRFCDIPEIVVLEE